MITIKVKIENDHRVLEKLEKIMASISDLSNLVTTLVTDTTTALADIKADLVALAANQQDPATAAGINDAVAKLTDLDTAIKAADPGPQPTPPAPPAAT